MKRYNKIGKLKKLSVLMFGVKEKISKVTSEEDITTLMERDREFMEQLGKCNPRDIFCFIYEGLEDLERDWSVPALRVRAKLLTTIARSLLPPGDSSLAELHEEMLRECVPLNSSLSESNDQHNMNKLYTTNNIFGVLLYEAGAFGTDVLKHIIKDMFKDLEFREYAEALVTVFKEVLVPMKERDPATQKFLRDNLDDLCASLKSVVSKCDEYDDCEDCGDAYAALEKLFSELRQ